MRLLLVAVLMTVAATAAAYESDQYSNRLARVDDSLDILDKRVNDAIGKVIRDWGGNGEKADRNVRFAEAIYHELGGLSWSDKIERWVLRTSRVEKYPQTRYGSIYQGLPFWGRRVNFFFGIGATIKVNGVRLGSDKLGHFFSQGLKYYKREQRGWSEERVLDFGAVGERWIWGQLMTGVYSNADLVANYEGMRFYKSLFEDGVIDGKGPIIEWRDGKPVQRRDFTWADHVNDYWDEALNPSYVVDSLYTGLRKHIREKCPQYYKNPSAFTAEDDEALWNRYKKLGLRDMRENKFRNICSDPEQMTAAHTPD